MVFLKQGLTLKTRLALNLSRSLCFYLPYAGVTGVRPTPGPTVIFEMTLSDIGASNTAIFMSITVKTKAQMLAQS